MRSEVEVFFFLRSHSLASLSKLDSPCPPRAPPPQAQQWLPPSASRLPQVRTRRCCLQRGDSKGAVATSKRRSIEFLASFFTLFACSLSVSLALFCSSPLLLAAILASPREVVSSTSTSAPSPCPRGALLLLPRRTKTRACPSHRAPRRTRDAKGAALSEMTLKWEALIERLCCRRRFFLFLFFSPSLALSSSLFLSQSTGARVAVGARRPSAARPRVAPIVAAGAPAYVPDMDKRVSEGKGEEKKFAVVVVVVVVVDSGSLALCSSSLLSLQLP